MQPSTRGLVVLAAAVVLGSCSGDPTDSIRESETKVVATPATVFVTQGGSKFVVVSLVDGMGNQVAADFTEQNVGTGITVTKDDTYLPINGGGSPHLQTSTRFVVSGVDATSTTFEVAAGGVTDTIPVKVIPTGAGIPLVTVASTGPSATDPTVLTVPAPFIFHADSSVVFAAGEAIVISRAADGRSITILAPPGTTTTGAASIAVDYLPAVAIATTTDVPLTVSPTVATAPEAGDPATAPEIAIGGSGGVFAGGTYAAATCGSNSGVPCQLYKVVLPTDAILDVSATGSGPADIGVYFLTADGLTDTGACDEHFNLTDSPEGTAEHCEIELAAGTYLAAVVSFGPFYTPPDPNPDFVRLEITTLEP